MHDRVASSLAGTDRTVLAINSLLRQQWCPLALSVKEVVLKTA